jgi:hypothetical protein
MVMFEMLVHHEHGLFVLLLSGKDSITQSSEFKNKERTVLEIEGLLGTFSTSWTLFFLRLFCRVVM